MQPHPRPGTDQAAHYSVVKAIEDMTQLVSMYMPPVPVAPIAPPQSVAAPSDAPLRATAQPPLVSPMPASTMQPVQETQRSSERNSLALSTPSLRRSIRTNSTKSTVSIPLSSPSSSTKSQRILLIKSKPRPNPPPPHLLLPLLLPPRLPPLHHRLRLPHLHLPHRHRHLRQRLSREGNEKRQRNQS